VTPPEAAAAVLVADDVLLLDVGDEVVAGDVLVAGDVVVAGAVCP